MLNLGISSAVQVCFGSKERALGSDLTTIEVCSTYWKSFSQYFLQFGAILKSTWAPTYCSLVLSELCGRINLPQADFLDWEPLFS